MSKKQIIISLVVLSACLVVAIAALTWRSEHGVTEFTLTCDDRSYGFSLDLPDNWGGYTAEVRDTEGYYQDPGCNNITFDAKGGWLTLMIWRNDDWTDWEEQRDGPRMIGSGMVDVMHTGTHVITARGSAPGYPINKDRFEGIIDATQTLRLIEN